MRCLTWLRRAWLAGAFAAFGAVQAQVAPNVVDIPTRPGVTQRLLLLEPAAPKAVVLLFAGGHGGLRLSLDGAMQWGEGNFLIRSRQLFAQEGLLVAVVDTPSDRQSPPYLAGFRQRPEHAADIRAAIAWLRQRAKLPVWLVGTSAGTWSVGYAATELSGAEAPDGIVLSATITDHDKFRPVSGMPLERIRLPVLLVHHENDECRRTRFADLPLLMDKLANVSKKQVLAFKGGANRGDPCEAFAHHGFDGLERDVVRQTAAWILAP